MPVSSYYAPEIDKATLAKKAYVTPVTGGRSFPIINDLLSY